MATLPEEASSKLDELLRKPSTGKLITSKHRKIVAQICDEVREAGMPVERLVVILKNVLDRAPHADDAAHSRSELKDRLVGVCIEEYFKSEAKATS